MINNCMDGIGVVIVAIQVVVRGDRIAFSVANMVRGYPAIYDYAYCLSAALPQGHGSTDTTLQMLLSG